MTVYTIFIIISSFCSSLIQGMIVLLPMDSWKDEIESPECDTPSPKSEPVNPEELVSVYSSQTMQSSGSAIELQQIDTSKSSSAVGKGIEYDNFI